MTLSAARLSNFIAFICGWGLSFLAALLLGWARYRWGMGYFEGEFPYPDTLLLNFCNWLDVPLVTTGQFGPVSKWIWVPMWERKLSCLASILGLAKKVCMFKHAIIKLST